MNSEGITVENNDSSFDQGSESIRKSSIEFQAQEEYDLPPHSASSPIKRASLQSLATESASKVPKGSKMKHSANHDSSLRRSSSVPPSRRGSVAGRRSSNASLIGRNKLQGVYVSDANSIVDLYEKGRLSVGSTSFP